MRIHRGPGILPIHEKKVIKRKNEYYNPQLARRPAQAFSELSIGELEKHKEVPVKRKK